MTAAELFSSGVVVVVVRCSWREEDAVAGRRRTEVTAAAGSSEEVGQEGVSSGGSTMSHTGHYLNGDVMHNSTIDTSTHLHTLYHFTLKTMKTIGLLLMTCSLGTLAPRKMLSLCRLFFCVISSVIRHEYYKASWDQKYIFLIVGN